MEGVTGVTDVGQLFAAPTSLGRESGRVASPECRLFLTEHPFLPDRSLVPEEIASLGLENVRLQQCVNRPGGPGSYFLVSFDDVYRKMT